MGKTRGKGLIVDMKSGLMQHSTILAATQTQRNITRLYYMEEISHRNSTKPKQFFQNLYILKITRLRITRSYEKVSTCAKTFLVELKRWNMRLRIAT